MNRTSLVNTINVKDLSLDSVLEIGDSAFINLHSKGLAVQRQAELFFENEGNFSNYNIFTKPLHVPAFENEVTFSKMNLSPFIKVCNIRITGAAASSVLQIGSNKSIQAEARIKHIRQINPLPKETGSNTSLSVE